jgi:hypothetical protein
MLANIVQEVKEINPLELLKKSEPELVPVLLLNGTLNNGPECDFAIREDRGDQLLETADPEAVHRTLSPDLMIAVLAPAVPCVPKPRPSLRHSDRGIH